MNSRARILTGIDLPLQPSCGSMIFCSDLYRQMRSRANTTFIALPPVDPTWQHGFDTVVLSRAAKAPYGPEFAAYVDTLTAEVTQHLAEHPVDVVHAQHLGFGLALALVRAARHLPVLAVAHGTDVIAAAQSPQAHAALTEIVESATVVVAPNTALAEQIDTLSGQRHTEKIALVPWGIPLDRTRPSLRPAAGKTLRLLHAGRLDANKNTVTAVDAMALTRGEHELTIIGDGPQRTALQQHVQQLRLTQRVHFADFQPRHELWRRFADHDAFIFTTSGLEAFGLVAIEAQAHGLPVLYADIAGLTNTLGAAGLPFAPAQPAALAQAVDQLAGDPALQRSLTAAGLANAARYDVTHSGDQLAELTLSAIGAAA
jgi:glycosyltransferase involved in cell wall biosynthesis